LRQIEAYSQKGWAFVFHPLRLALYALRITNYALRHAFSRITVTIHESRFTLLMKHAPGQLRGEGGMKFLKGKMSERIQVRPLWMIGKKKG